MAAAPATEAAAGAVGRVVDELADDPILFFVKILRLIGVAALVAGAAAALVGFYLKSEAIKSHNDAVAKAGAVTSAWGGVGAQFGNLAPLQNPLQNSERPITTPNPLTDLANLGSDVGGFFSGVFSDAGTALGDLGQAIADIPKAIWALGGALGTTFLAVPSLLWDEVVWGIGGSVANVLLWAFPYLLTAGTIAIVASVALGSARVAWRSSVRPAYVEQQAIWGERQKGRIWTPAFQKLFHNPPPAIVGQTADAPEAPPSPPDAPAQVPAPPEPVALEAPAAPPAPAPPVEVPANPVGPTPTVEVEEHLGGHHAIEPTAEELRAQEEERRRTLPTEDVHVEVSVPEDLEVGIELTDLDRQRAILAGPLEA